MSIFRAKKEKVRHPGQFQPGQSGNPKGRPKKPPQLDLGDDKYQLLFQRLWEKVLASGDTQTAKLLLEAGNRKGESPPGNLVIIRQVPLAGQDWRELKARRVAMGQDSEVPHDLGVLTLQGESILDHPATPWPLKVREDIPEQGKTEKQPLDGVEDVKGPEFEGKTQPGPSLPPPESNSTVEVAAEPISTDENTQTITLPGFAKWAAENLRQAEEDDDDR